MSLYRHMLCNLGFLVFTADAVDWGLVFGRKSWVINKWPDDYIASNIEIRLVKKPPGYTESSTEKILSQAPYDTEAAHKFLREVPDYDFESQPLKVAENLFLGSAYNINQESIVIVHTVSEEADEKYVKNTVNSLQLRNFHLLYNIFIVRMPDLNHFMSSTIKRVILGFHNQYSTLGRIIGGFLQKGVEMNKLQLDQTHLIGYCFSAQLTGYIARAVPGKIKSILALDPYSFGLTRVSMRHLSKTDAKTVHALHTSGITVGSTRRLATADFVFNNGNIQPGCWFFDISCSHGRALPFLWFAILYSDLFVSRQCSSYLYFRLCGCEKNPSVIITYPLNPLASGTYYIRTSKHHPFGMKDAGASCRPFSTPKSALSEES